MNVFICVNYYSLLAIVFRWDDEVEVILHEKCLTAPIRTTAQYTRSTSARSSDPWNLWNSMRGEYYLRITLTLKYQPSSTNIISTGEIPHHDLLVWQREEKIRWSRTQPSQYFRIHCWQYSDSSQTTRRRDHGNGMICCIPERSTAHQRKLSTSLSIELTPPQEAGTETKV